jgi:hypothetical protein
MVILSVKEERIQDKKESINTVLTLETKSIEKDKIKGLINKLY